MSENVVQVSVVSVCLTVFAVAFLFFTTSCEKARYQAFVDGGYVEQSQPGTNESRWVKP
jgi:hypothetical protein